MTLEYRCSECGALLETTNANPLHDEIVRLRAACERMMIGGNHIALYKTKQWPDPGTDHMVAIEKIGTGQSYDMWCCWNAIMEARRALDHGLPTADDVSRSEEGMSDILKQLRSHPCKGGTVTEQFRAMLEQRIKAADEIERLWAVIELRADNERLASRD